MNALKIIIRTQWNMLAGLSIFLLASVTFEADASNSVFIPQTVCKTLNGNREFSTDPSATLNRMFELPQACSWELAGRELDRLGVEHIRYNMLVRGIPVEGSCLVVHLDKRSTGHSFVTGQLVRPDSCLTSDLAAIRGRTPEEFYRQWDPTASKLAHKGGWKWISLSNDQYMRLALVETYMPATSLEPMRVVFPVSDPALSTRTMQICHADVPGQAITAYYGQQTIPCFSDSGIYFLNSTLPGGGVETRNVNHHTNYQGLTSYTDADNYWLVATTGYAGDAQFAASSYADLLQDQFGRNSIDNNGCKLISYLNYGNSLANAFWNGNAVVYGSGSNGNGPWTTLDIAGHEFTHGLVQETAGLNYSGEPGTINEAIADMFGASLEHKADPNEFNWLIGEKSGTVLRNMSLPESYNQPSCYLGPGWYTGSGDQGGVHINSGFLNRWFYLACAGGSGVNSLGQPYAVTGAGMNGMIEIVYHTLTCYLVSGSGFEDFRTYTLQSAADLYGGCSAEYAAVADGWKAVGFGGNIGAAPMVESISGTSFCHGDSLRLECHAEPGSVFTWYVDGQAVSTTTEGGVYIHEPGMWRVSVSRCSATTISNAIAITMHELPMVATVHAEICAGIPVNLEGWPAGGAFSVPNPYTGQSTAFVYSYTDMNGCTSSAQGSVFTRSLPVINILNEPGSIPENGAPVLLEADLPGTFSGQGVEGGYFNPATAGHGGPYSISVTYTDGAGCTGSDEIHFEVGAPCARDLSGIWATASTDQMLPGTQVMFTTNASADDFSISWIVPTGSTAVGSTHGKTMIVVWGNEPGGVVLELKNSCGEIQMLRPEAAQTTSNVEIKLSVFPNPAMAQVTFQWDPGQDMIESVVFIFNASGTLIGRATTLEGKLVLNTSELAAGFYSCEIHRPTGLLRARFVVAK